MGEQVAAGYFENYLNLIYVSLNLRFHGAKASSAIKGRKYFLSLMTDESRSGF